MPEGCGQLQKEHRWLEPLRHLLLASIKHRIRPFAPRWHCGTPVQRGLPGIAEHQWAGAGQAQPCSPHPRSQPRASLLYRDL